jgi:hypothetical protein
VAKNIPSFHAGPAVQTLISSDDPNNPLPRRILLKKHKAADDKRRSASNPSVRERIESAALEQTVPAATADAARQRMIAEAAYYRAEKRGFAPGNDLDDWLAAEAEVAGSAFEKGSLPVELH